MSAEGSASSQRGNEDSIESGATPLELFFDLVFVFAFTQVTSFLSNHLTWVGKLQGAGLLAVLWWAWVGYFPSVELVLQHPKYRTDHAFSRLC